MDKYIGALLGGRYEIIEVLGVGGMAVVYKARDRVLNRFVAIKTLKREFSQDEEFRRRFYNESQAVAKLSHNNIVAVYDVAHSDGIDYIVMELMDGISLKEYLQKKGHLSWQETIFFAQQIAKALEHAHSRGIIHQDIKPHNIMLLRDGTAKVTDFGIARLESDQETRVMKEAIGSVHYISPEQAKGSPLDSRTDLYSLGVVMYEMLTGKLPFEGETAVAIVMQHINSVPPLPSQVVQGIPKGMDDIVMHAMCPSVAKRYVNAQQLYNDLERIKLNAGANFGYHGLDPRRDSAMFDQTRAISYNRRQQEDLQYGQEEIARKRREDRSYDSQRRRRRKKKTFMERLSESPAALAGIAVAIFAVIAIAVGALLLTSGSTEKIPVPNFVGKNIDEVLADSQYADFHLEENAERVYRSGANEGEIIEQDPVATKKVAKGTKITLTVCGTADDKPEEDEQDKGYKLQDFTNTSLSEVERILTNHEIPYEIKEEASDEIDKDYVIRTSPGKDAEVTKEDTVTIYVSTGKADENQNKVEVPSLTGRTLESARSILNSSGLAVGKTSEKESDYAAGEVCEQSISKGTTVDKDTKIDLVISKGPKQEEPTTTNPPENPDNNNPSNNNDTPPTPEPAPDDTTQPPEPEKTTGTAKIRIALPDSPNSNVNIYLADGTLIFSKTFSQAGGTQPVTVEGPLGENMLKVIVNGTESAMPVTFN